MQEAGPASSRAAVQISRLCWWRQVTARMMSNLASSTLSLCASWPASKSPLSRPFSNRRAQQSEQRLCTRSSLQHTIQECAQFRVFYAKWDASKAEFFAKLGTWKAVAGDLSLNNGVGSSASYAFQAYLLLLIASGACCRYLMRTWEVLQYISDMHQPWERF